MCADAIGGCDLHRMPQNQCPRTAKRTGPEGRNDARTGMPGGLPPGAMCVQRFDDSLNSAIHITYRISLRSSSMPEPRDPLLKVLLVLFLATQKTSTKKLRVWRCRRAPLAGRHACGRKSTGKPAETTPQMVDSQGLER